MTNTENMTLEQYNALAARTFADYMLGKRPDYLPTKYTGTEEQDNHTATGAEKKKAQQLAADLLAGKEVDDDHTNPTATANQRTNAHNWANNLMNRNNS